MNKKLSAEQYYENAAGRLKRGDAPGAVLDLQEAILLRPDYAEAYNNRGVALQMIGNNFDAWIMHEKAIEYNPRAVEHYNNAGSALINMGELQLARKHFAKALELQPIFGEAEINLGNICRQEKNVPQALEHYRKAVAARGTLSDAHLNLAFALLELGHFDEGWKEYNWRWKCTQLPPRGLAIPPWEGQRGKRVLIYGEQGLGDMVQFARLAPLVQAKYDCEVVVEVRRPLLRLVQTMKGVHKVIALGDPIPQVDYALPMLSVPCVIGTDMDEWGKQVPYFHIDPQSIQIWRERLSKLPPGLRIGVCWAGQSRMIDPIAMAVDARRSTTLDSFAPMARIGGISWVSLQKGPPSLQVRVPPMGMTILDDEENLEDFYDTAALMHCLDLVISVDTSVVHVAGALGIPTWLLSRFDNCWRWMGERKDSPWYPSIRQFRQPAMGDWPSLMQEVAEELGQFVQQHSCKAA